MRDTGVIEAGGREGKIKRCSDVVGTMVAQSFQATI